MQTKEAGMFQYSWKLPPSPLAVTLRADLQFTDIPILLGELVWFEWLLSVGKAEQNCINLFSFQVCLLYRFGGASAGAGLLLVVGRIHSSHRVLIIK